MSVFNTIREEVRSYQQDTVDLAEGIPFSQYKLVRRISLYENQQYPKGKLDSQGDYKYWYDIISPRVNTEIKNIDFDSNNIMIYSDTSIKDSLAVYLSNVKLGFWLKETGQSEELNDAVEEFSALGNVVWKKVKGGYERVDLKNFYVINQTAKTLNDTAVIERHLLTQSDLRKKEGVWKNVQDVIDKCGNLQFAREAESTASATTNPYYEIYERNGEIKESELFTAQGKDGGSDKKFVMAKIIVAGISKSKESSGIVLFAEKISEMPYREAHRGRYKGRWWREGMYEILFDCQTRANQLGNQIAKGLEWASKTIFRSSDDMIVQNLLTDLRSGDVIRTRDLTQVDVRMQGLDQMMVDWNRNLQVADLLANSYEIVQGQTMPSNTPFKLGNLLNQNANKLFDFLREKLGIGFRSLLEDWVVPELMADLTAQKVIDLTNSEDNLKEFYKMVTNAWYVKNLINLPPHTSEIAQTLKESKMTQLMEDGKASLKVVKGFWDNFIPRVKVTITGENVRLAVEMESLLSFIQLETDPIRRSYLIEMAMAKQNIDISSLPRSEPEQLLGLTQPSAQTNQANENKKAVQ